VIHGGPMAGRKNFQTCAVQEIRADEIYQISWLEGESRLTFVPPNERR
jgi:hypothetical protein